MTDTTATETVDDARDNRTAEHGEVDRPKTQDGRTKRVRELFNYAVAHQRAERLDAAEPLYLDFLARSPDYSRAWTNYGVLLEDRGLLQQAIAAHRRALQLEPDLTSARHNLAKTLSVQGQFEEALELRQALFETEPDSPERERDLCIVLRGLNRHEEVVARIDRAEAEGRADAGCLMQRSLSRLILGDFAGGFADYEQRHDSGEIGLPKNAAWPRWQGEDLDGKRLLVLPEQGFGDAVLTARFLPGLKAMGAEVHMRVKKPLLRLFERLEGVDRMAETIYLKESYDYYTPNMSLPHFVGMDDDGQPPPPARLHIPEDSRKRAKQIAGPFRDRFRVGIVWTGSLSYKSNHRRSVTPEDFLGLAQVPGVQLFSLYKGEAHQGFMGSGMPGLIVDACGDDRDFADSAAIIDEMDLMITTDTAVVHIAASLGKPIWNLLSHEGFWIYGMGETTPWYPSMRLFRQETQGDWVGLFERVEKELRAYLENRSPRR